MFQCVCVFSSHNRWQRVQVSFSLWWDDISQLYHYKLLQGLVSANKHAQHVHIQCPSTILFEK